MLLCAVCIVVLGVCVDEGMPCHWFLCCLPSIKEGTLKYRMSLRLNPSVVKNRDAAIKKVAVCELSRH